MYMLMEKGLKLGDVMAEFPNIFDQTTIQSIIAGQNSGNMEKMLHETAAQKKQVYFINKKIKSSLKMPKFVFIFALLLFLGMDLFLLPKFSTIFEELEAPTPFFFRIM